MPTANPTSLRDEFARLKGKYGALSAAGKVPEETRVLMMSAVFVPLEAIFFERATRKYGTNSGLPPTVGWPRGRDYPAPPDC